MTDNSTTAEDIRKKVTARQSYWYEASFILGLIPALMSLVIAWIGQQIFGLEPKIQDTKIILIPLALISSVFFGYALATRRSMLIEIQALKAYADGLKALFKGNIPLKDAYMNIVLIMAQSLRGEKSKSPRTAMTELYKAFDPEKSNAGNGGIPKFARSFNIVISRKLRATPTAITIAMVIFLAIVTITTFLTPQGEAWNWWDASIQLALVYAFSIIFLVSVNMLKVFGTRGSQFRVSELIGELLEGIDESSE